MINRNPIIFTNTKRALVNIEVSLGSDKAGITPQIESSTAPQNKNGIENISQNIITPHE